MVFIVSNCLKSCFKQFTIFYTVVVFSWQLIFTFFILVLKKSVNYDTLFDYLYVSMSFRFFLFCIFSSFHTFFGTISMLKEIANSSRKKLKSLLYLDADRPDVWRSNDFAIAGKRFYYITSKWLCLMMELDRINITRFICQRK